MAPYAYPPRTSPHGTSAGWSTGDRVALAACWTAGISLCLIAAAIVIYMAVQGAQYMNIDLFTTSPLPELDQSKSGGFKDPIIGTFLLTIIGTAIALPLGVITAVWLVEYGRPAWLARMVESGVEIVAGTPSIVLAIFGLLVFSQQALSFLSATAEGGAVFGRSFIAAGVMMSLIALPLIVGATREALMSIPSHVREASYALGKTKAATIRRVLLPAIRPGIGTGTALGMGRIVGDTAIVVVLLGASLQIEPGTDQPILGTLRGTGSTLTSFVYGNSPAGEGNAPEKAYAAAFVLMLVVILLNILIDRFARGRGAKGVPQWGR
jgi:phosphate transport system permease protein